MQDSFDVIVIGSGAIGAACGRELALAGRRVLLLDRTPRGGEAWSAAAGMLAPQIEAGPDDPIFQLGIAARERYVDLAPALQESVGIDIGLWLDGIARVAVAAEDVAELRARAAWQRQQGHLCDWFDPAEVKARYPWIGANHGALWAPRDGALDPSALVNGLRADAQRLGATVDLVEQAALLRDGDRVVGVQAGRKYSAEHVVVAAGAWSAEIGGLPRPVSVEPVRGQMAALPWPEGIEPAIVHGGNGYVVARGGEAIIGSTMEFAGFDPSTTSAGLARIFAAASALCPSLTGLSVTRTWAGLRPMTPDGRPIIGAEPRARGLWYATGHGRNGILLAAMTGAVVASLIGEQSITVEGLAAVSPERFWRW
ncbi:MAG TPA: glycine oxidase ThiO [Gemmatimonadales bacterium]|nr:glycine oxidase ThiO [Gemmatimonadales bacterium]